MDPSANEPGVIELAPQDGNTTRCQMQRPVSLEADEAVAGPSQVLLEHSSDHPVKRSGRLHFVAMDSDLSDVEEDFSVPLDASRSVSKTEAGPLLHSAPPLLPVDDDDLEEPSVSFLSVPSKCAEQAEEFVRKDYFEGVAFCQYDEREAFYLVDVYSVDDEEVVTLVWAAGWNVVHHHTLPDWLKDNDFLLRGHRTPTNSFLACFKSIFRIHTETGNIWTHLLGMIAFLGIAAYFLTRPTIEVQWQEKAVFSAFFLGAILCLGFSWIFHTVYCHSERVGRLFNKLDYCGIALLTIGSFVPWLYYSFYCRIEPKITYLVLIFVLGTCCIIVSMWDKFAQPKFRPVRAGMFVGLGLSGVIPALHYVITDGFWHAINKAALGWLVLMAFLYIFGAVIYAVRIPERIFPGKFDIWFQSHQIFHMFVLAGAFVHYHGISEIANYRLTLGDCLESELA